MRTPHREGERCQFKHNPHDGAPPCEPIANRSHKSAKLSAVFALSGVYRLLFWQTNNAHTVQAGLQQIAHGRRSNFIFISFGL